MADHQTEPRLTVDLPVRIWGMGANGRPFSQQARAQNISSEGALISEVETELKVGDVVGLQCEDRKTRCTVIWVMNTGVVNKNQVGVKLVAEQECPWRNYLPMDNATVTISASNRRQWHRHKISLPLEIRDERVNAPSRINATDVSGNGCYVENMLPFPLGTVLRLDFWIDSEHMRITAVVRTCDPGVGNGIEFTGLPVDGKSKMQAYLDTIDPPRAFSNPKPKEEKEK
jgi:hypothetical protein